MAKVTVLKAHRSADLGRMVDAGETIEIDAQRQRALARNGIVPPLEGDEIAQPRDGALTNASFKSRREPLTELKDDGPTVEEWVTAGYRASKYPPSGYKSKSSPAEIKAAVDAQRKADKAKAKSEK